jgi:fructokinase
MREASEKRVISLDPNIRPGFIKDKRRHIWARIGRMAAMSDILKFSDEDLEWFGIAGNHDELAAHWLNQGAKLVVVTKGAEGADGLYEVAEGLRAERARHRRRIRSALATPSMPASWRR